MASCRFVIGLFTSTPVSFLLSSLVYKVAVGHVAIATAINVVHLMGWLRGEASAQTRTSPIKRVMKPAA